MEVRAYKVESSAVAEVKKVLEKQEGFEQLEGKQVWIANPFARNGYVFREAHGIGVAGSDYYVYIKTEDSEFFKKNEKQLLVPGVKKLEGKELEEVKNKVEEQENSAAAGMGAVFEGF